MGQTVEGAHFLPLKPLIAVPILTGTTIAAVFDYWRFSSTLNVIFLLREKAGFSYLHMYLFVCTTQTSGYC